MFTTWTRTLLRHALSGRRDRRRPSAPRKTPHFRPRLEGLETRVVLATRVFDGGPCMCGTAWRAPINWSGDLVPGASDDAVIGTGTILHLPNATLHIARGPVNNTGVYEFTDGGAITAGVANPFVNSGVLRKSGGGEASLGFAFTNAGEVRVQDGTLRFARDFTNTGDVVLEADTTALAVDGGYVQTAGSTLLVGGYLTASGLVDIRGGRLLGTGVIGGDVRNAGLVEVGAAGEASFLVVTGAYTQAAAGRLEVELYGAGIADLLYVVGRATLNGTLDIRLRSGYVPKAGDVHLPLLWGEQAGMFATINGLTISPTREWYPYFFEQGLLLFAYDV